MKNKELLVGLVQSAVRMVLAWVVGVIGYQAVEGDIERVVAVVTGIAIAGGSLAWSYAEKKAWWQKEPPKDIK